MAEPVIPLTFPYKPNGGWTNEDIWGKPKPALDLVTPDGSSFESRERIKKLGFDTLEALLERYRIKYGTKPDPIVYTQYRDPNTYPANEEGPVIHITGEAMPPKSTNWGSIVMVGALFVVLLLVLKKG